MIFDLDDPDDRNGSPQATPPVRAEGKIAYEVKVEEPAVRQLGLPVVPALPRCVHRSLTTPICVEKMMAGPAGI